MNTVVSRDGTRIAFDRAGDGPAVILVDGALSYRAAGPNPPLAALLAEHFTVFTYDRRGRGESGDRAPYDVQREVDDLAALVALAGGSAYVYGISSGAVLALEAANRGVAIGKLALYEAPFVVDDGRPPVPAGYRRKLDELLAAGRRGDAVRLFLTKAVRVPRPFVAMMRFMPAWKKLKGVAHTLPYDAQIMGDTQSGRPLPADRWASVNAPALVVGGGKSPDWMQNSVRALAGVLPDARERTLEGQTHLVKPAALAPALVEFFGDSAGRPA
jgi:pimeloyl-ACP methyl ester carboxylesterase